MLSAAYGGVARLRRSWYERHPEHVRRLGRPVISVGNLVVGGSGKTPVVAALARMLQAHGERPAVLSRGYGRRSSTRAVVMVSDGARVLVPVEQSGDEPQMLARALQGVAVLVSADRYDAGRYAERELDSTVLLLDDGFQHVQLARDVNLLVVSAADLSDRVLPAGRLRESLGAAAAADALLVPGDAADADRVAAAVQVRRAFQVVPSYAAPVLAVPYGAPLDQPRGRRVFALSGIARPQRFIAALRDHGWEVVGESAFADHHWFTAADLRRIHERARGVEAELILTTEKDAVRLESLYRHDTAPPGGPQLAYVPMTVTIRPQEAFSSWLLAECERARGRSVKAP